MGVGTRIVLKHRNTENKNSYMQTIFSYIYIYIYVYMYIYMCVCVCVCVSTTLDWKLKRVHMPLHEITDHLAKQYILIDMKILHPFFFWEEKREAVKSTLKWVVFFCDYVSGFLFPDLNNLIASSSLHFVFVSLSPPSFFETLATLYWWKPKKTLFGKNL